MKGDARIVSRLLVLFAVLIPCAAIAEPPIIDYVFPAGGRQGTTNIVTIGGKIEPWPVQVWSDHPGLIFKAEEAKGKLTIQIATNAPPGAHLVRFFNQDGASAPRCFVVGQTSEISDKEPNDNFETAQKIEKLPITINGRLEKSGDADSFLVHMEAGQWLIAAVAAYSLDAPLDPVLQLLDDHGNKIGFNHDGSSLDPFLVYHAPQSGDYVVQLTAFSYPPKADIRLAGGDSSVYRLTLTVGPVGEYAFPAGIERGHSSALQIFGWNLGATGRALLREIDASQLKPRAHRIRLGRPSIENEINVPIGDAPEQIEVEPNDSRDLASPITVPGAINGRIVPERDQDRFQITAKKGDRFKFAIQSATLGLPLDAVLALEDASGKQLTRSDDSGNTPDPELTWTAPADGSYFLAVSDLLHRGASNFVYRCVIDRPQPDFSAVIEAHAFRIEAAKSTEMKVTVSRIENFAANLHLVVEDLPDGVTASSPRVPEKGGEVKVILSAAETAKAVNQPIRVAVVATDPDAPRVRIAGTKLKGQNAAAGGLLINETDQLWLTVVPKPAPEKKEEKPDAKKE